MSRLQGIGCVVVACWVLPTLFLAACHRDQVVGGPEEPADVIVCLRTDLTSAEYDQFDDWFFGGGVPRTPISSFLNDSAFPAIAIAWGEGADDEGKRAFIEALAAEPRVLRVVENSSMVDACGG